MTATNGAAYGVARPEGAADSLVGVIGAGTMGAGIAQVAAQAGHRVALYDALDGAAARAVTGLAARFDSLAAQGKLSAEEAEGAKARLSVADSLDDMKDAVLVVEAVIEDLKVKQDLFARVEQIVGPDCALATNTSSLSITAIAAGLQDPSRLVGMHFFNPAPLMPLVEIIEALATDPNRAETVRDYADGWGKTTVLCRSTPGFIVNRVARPFYAEALRAYEEGVGRFATVDAVVRESGGFKMGPFELMDMIGLDVNLAVSTSVWEATGYDPRYTPAWVQKEHVAAGRLGRKSGHGFYDYSDGVARPEPQYEAEYPAPDFSPLAKVVTLNHLFSAMEDGVVMLPGGALVARSAGRTATSYGDGRILVDLVLDVAGAETIAVAPAADSTPQHLLEAFGFFQAHGKKVLQIEDVPGLITTRIVARLVNEAVDAMFRGDAEEDDIDLAMRLGVNYPRGPLEWGADIGFARVLTILDNLEDTYRDGRYRASPLLRKLAHADRLMDGPLARQESLDRIRPFTEDPE